MLPYQIYNIWHVRIWEMETNMDKYVYHNYKSNPF